SIVPDRVPRTRTPVNSEPLVEVICGGWSSVTVTVALLSSTRASCSENPLPQTVSGDSGSQTSSIATLVVSRPVCMASPESSQPPLFPLNGHVSPGSGAPVASTICGCHAGPLSNRSLFMLIALIVSPGGATNCQPAAAPPGTFVACCSTSAAASPDVLGLPPVTSSPPQFVLVSR